jgi:hypothetical protein
MHGSTTDDTPFDPTAHFINQNPLTHPHPINAHPHTKAGDLAWGWTNALVLGVQQLVTTVRLTGPEAESTIDAMLAAQQAMEEALLVGTAKARAPAVIHDGPQALGWTGRSQCRVDERDAAPVLGCPHAWPPPPQAGRRQFRNESSRAGAAAPTPPALVLANTNTCNSVDDAQLAGSYGPSLEPTS